MEYTNTPTRKVPAMNLLLLTADLVAIVLLVSALYLPRRGRRELTSSFLVTNIGVLAVATAMSTGTIGAGLGLGLFGVLSIIRLRSEELSHREIAYYFAALSLGLIGGLGSLPLIWGIGLMVLVLLAVAVGDHPWLAAREAGLELTIDQAIVDRRLLAARVATLVDGKITGIQVRHIDQADDTTEVLVRYRPAPPLSGPGPTEPALRPAARGMAAR